jgi:probable HAF family extracellular repeat protein
MATLRVKLTVMGFTVAIAATMLLALPAVAGAVPSAAPSLTLIDPGTFGGPQSFLDLPAIPIAKDGTLLGQADMSVLDSDFQLFTDDPYVLHALAYRKGQLVDLGALPGENSSAVFEMNGSSVGAGVSENGLIDPLTGIPEIRAVLFKDGQVVDLGTLQGGNESFAVAINNRGQVAGFSSNGTSDPFSFFGWGTQTRVFIWQDGVMTDIGSLGGPDTDLATMNARGQIAGDSFTNSTPNAATGVPTIDPYLWQNGRLQDLGSLGGTLATVNWLSDRGEVVGQSDLAGDQSFHPFLWNGTRMLDLGTLGGDNGTAIYVNDAGEVVGKADLPDGTHDAFSWRNGVMRDLKPLYGAPCSYAAAVNNRGVVVGNASDCQGNIVAALIWINGVPYDLNTLVAPSTLHLTEAKYITDQGQIVGKGVFPNGDTHIFLLVPTHR